MYSSTFEIKVSTLDEDIWE